MKVGRKKVALSRRKINELWSAARELQMSNEPLHQRFSYAVAYNQDVVEREVKAFDAVVKNDKKYQLYDEERIALARKHANKDKDGEPVQRNGVYVMKDPLSFERALDALREKHPAHQKREDFLDEEVDFEFHVVKMRHVPAYLGVGQMSIFRCFIEDEEEEFRCPACGVELCMDGDKLKELYEEEAEEEEPTPKKATPIKQARRKRRMG
jgi:hypothetical protein